MNGKLNNQKNRQAPAPFCITYLVLCVILSVGGALSSSWYDLFGATLEPEYIWQYISYAFMHGAPGMPLFILIHLALNAVIFWKVGQMAENLIGTKHMLFLSLLACGGFFITQQAVGIAVNGASGVIWSYSSVLFGALLSNRNRGLSSVLSEWEQYIRMWLIIMWVIVTLFMGFVPYLFGSDEPLWKAFLYGNVFHFQAVVIGLMYLWLVNLEINIDAWKRQY